MAKRKATPAARGRKRAPTRQRSRRKPAWGVVSFDELEAWRQDCGLPKKRLAGLIGVTNSTYHNWARGIAVATPNTQRKIRDMIDGGAPQETTAAVATEPGAPVVGSEVLSTTATIVTTYLQTTKSQLTPDILIRLVSDVRRALRG